MKDSVFCVVPARSGSVRIPDKNLREVGGVSLIARAVRTALGAFGRVVVSTDSAAYANAATEAGADVPGLRPAELGGPDVAMTQVICHALREWGRGEAMTVVVQATAPFLTSEDVLAVAELLRGDPGLRSALTAEAVSAKAAYAIAMDSGTFVAPDYVDLPTHLMPPLAVPSGGAYAAWTADLLDGATLHEPPIGVVIVDQPRCLDIDDEADLAAARAIAAQEP